MNKPMTFHGWACGGVSIAALLLSSAAYAGPSGGVVQAGSASIAQSGKNTHIQQHSDKIVIDWQGFDVAADELAQFHQPSSKAVALNRVNSQSASRIAGQLKANGNIMLVNPNGVVFEHGSKVDVNGLIATSSNIENADFMAGKFDFTPSGNPNAAIINHGTITAKQAGLVGLVAPRVENHGTITAKLGRVELASADRFSVDLYGDGLMAIEVSDAVRDQLIANTGSINAEGGTIALSAAAGREIVNSLIRVEGELKAPTVREVNGEIIISGGGKTRIGGKLDVSSNTRKAGRVDVRAKQTLNVTEDAKINADGGEGYVMLWSDDHTDFAGTISATGGDSFVETSGKNTLKIQDSARVSTRGPKDTSGLWLLDPQDFTIGAGGDISVATLETNLGLGDVAIESSGGGTAGNGDIIITDALGWSANNLTLTAARDVLVQDVVSVTGTGALTVNTATTNGGDTGVAGGALKMDLDSSGFNGRIDYTSSGALTINGDVYTIINSLGAEGSTTATDLQGMNGNLAGHYALGTNIDASATLSDNWNAGAGWDPVGTFTGKFDGLGHTVDGLFIDRSTTDNTGLFGQTNAALIRNVGVTNTNITGRQRVGGLVGYNNTNSSIINSYATGAVSGGSLVGGLVGQNADSSIRGSYAVGTINISGNRSGGLVASNINGSIIESYANSEIISTGNQAGGLAGANDSGSIIDSYATGDVRGNNFIGGLVGWNNIASVSNSYATGDVNSTGANAGGLVGWNDDSGSISVSYATGDVSSTGNQVGGLVGYNTTNSSISNSYATGSVNGGGSVGGLVGRLHDGGTISNSYSTGAVTGSSNLGGLVGLETSATATNSFWNTDTSGQATSAGGAGAVGKTTAQMMEFDTFNNAGWDISDTGGSAAVWRVYDGQSAPLLREFLTALTLTANDSKTYDGNAYTGGAVTGSGFKTGETVANLLGTVSYGGTSQGAVNAGSYTLSASGYYSGQSGYDISFADGALTVNKAALTVTADDASRAFGDANPAFAVSYSGFVTGEDETMLGTAPTASSAADATSAAGDYAITAAGGVDTNYSFSYVDGTLSVAAAPAPAAPAPVVTTPTPEPEIAVPEIDPIIVSSDPAPSAVAEAETTSRVLNAPDAIIIPSSVEYMMQNAPEIMPANTLELSEQLQLGESSKRKGFIGRLLTIHPILMRRLGYTKNNLPF